MANLETTIRGGKLDRVYLLSGDSHLRARVIDALRETAMPHASRAFNYDAMDGKSAGVSRILNAAQTLPMMGKQRLVLVREADGLAAADLAELLPYLADPSPTTVLVLDYKKKADGRTKFVQTAKKRKFLHDLAVPKAHQLPRWLEDEASERGIKLQREAAHRLAQVIGGELGNLSAALEQLALFAADRAITVTDVDSLIADTSERTVFQLSDAVGEGAREAALRVVAKLFAQRQSPIGVIAMLARHFRQLTLARDAVSSRVPFRDLPRLLGAPPFAVDGLLAQAKRYEPAQLTGAILLLSRADQDFKGSRKAALGERVLMEQLVGQLIELAK